MAGKYFWIKERYNPQLGTYYILQGRITVAEAKRMESTLYGDNWMHKYKTETEYQSAIAKLIKDGEKVYQ